MQNLEYAQNYDLSISWSTEVTIFVWLIYMHGLFLLLYTAQFKLCPLSYLY